MDIIDNGGFEDIEQNITPQAFQRCESNSVEMGMKVRTALRGCLHGGRKILEGGTTFGRSGYQVEKEKKNNCRPLAAERPAAATFVLFVPLRSESSLHGARIFLVVGSSYLSA